MLRLVAAFFVIVSHSYGILDKGLQQPALWYGDKHIILSDVGLYIFFTISGYLVTQSLLNSNSIAHFYWKRFLRIVPALTVVNVFCVIAGCFLTSLPLKDYLSSPATWTYIIKNSTLIRDQFTLPGVFTNLKDNSANASIWTILLEVKFYLLLGLLGLMLLQREWLYLGLFIALQLVRIYCNITGFTITTFHLDTYFFFGTYFYLGSLLYCFRGRIPFKWFYVNMLLAVALLSISTVFEPLCLALLFSYVTVVIALGKGVTDFGGNDLSYGLYLYAFPMQQLVLVTFGSTINPWLHIGISTIVALLLAGLSWRYIEKPCLQMKNKWLGK